MFYSHNPFCREMRNLWAKNATQTVRNHGTNRSFAAVYSPAYDVMLELMLPCFDENPLKRIVFCNDTEDALTARKEAGINNGWGGDRRASLSTGLHAVFLALSACDHVDVYGYGPCAASAPCGSTCRYYTSSASPHEDGSGCGRSNTHAFDLEHKYLVHLDRCGFLRLK